MVTGMQDDSVYALVDEVLDDVHLAREVDFGGGAVPADFDSVIPAGRDSAGMHGLPEDQGLRFRHDRDDRPVFSPARGRNRKNKQQCDPEGFPETHMNGAPPEGLL